MSADERIAATLPRMITPGVRQREYTLVLTDARAIFVLDRDVRLWVYWVLALGLGALGFVVAFYLIPTTIGVIGGIVVGSYAGIGVGKLLMPRVPPPSPGSTADELSGRSGSRVIPYADVEAVVLAPSARRFPRVRFVLRRAGGATETFEVMAALELRRAMRATGRQIAEEMAGRAEDLRTTLAGALPPSLAPRLDTSRRDSGR